MATPKKHNTAVTSIMSWHECLESGLPIKEKNLVLKYLNEQTEPRTSRQIAYDLRKERTNITRSLFDLVNSDLIEVAKIDKCITTGKRVKYYSVVKQSNTIDEQ